MDDLNRKRHAVYKLTYHAVFVIKYRRRVMTEPIITHMRQYATHLIEQCYQGKLLELNGEPDHIHILFECVLSIENPQNRKENSPLSDREIPIIRKKHVESFRFFPYLVGKKAAFTAFCPIG